MTIFSLYGKVILIVEGTLLSGATVRDALVRAGAIVHVVSSVAAGNLIISNKRLDAAIIDTATHTRSALLCRELGRRAVPFFYSSFPERYQPHNVQADEARALIATLKDLVALHADDTPTAPSEPAAAALARSDRITRRKYSVTR
jgi:hypothetical protein